MAKTYMENYNVIMIRLDAAATAGAVTTDYRILEVEAEKNRANNIFRI